MNRTLLIFFLFLSVVYQLSGQVLSLDYVVRDVLANHPRVADIILQSDIAAAKLLKAKGGFDPVADFSWNQKDYDQKNYYSLVEGALKIPTNFGVSFKSGYELNRGLFLNSENNTPGGGLLFGGVSVPLGQGLLIDERRAERRKAEIGIDMAGLDIILDKNDLIYKTISRYTDWQAAYLTATLLQQALQTINQRYEAIRRQVERGDRPGLDTVEINIQRRLIELSFTQARVELENAKTLLGAYFWQNNTQTGLPATSLPDTLGPLPFSPWQVFNQSEFVRQHPLFNRYNLKRNQLILDKRLREDKLKPNLVFSYNPLFEPIGGNPFSNFQLNNQKLGLSFYMPLFLRKERGDVRLANVELTSLDFQVRDKAADLYAKYKAETDIYNTLVEQISIYNEAVSLYRQMYTAEQRLFDIGESSLFLVNTREQNFVQAQLKRVEYVAKMQKAYFQVLFTAGKLAEQFQ